MTDPQTWVGPTYDGLGELRHAGSLLELRATHRPPPPGPDLDTKLDMEPAGRKGGPFEHPLSCLLPSPRGDSNS
jgi:hypothetical protein